MAKRPYFVLSKRDRETEIDKSYGTTRLYDHCERTESLGRALTIARREPGAIIGKYLPIREKDLEGVESPRYVVAIEHDGKYKHYDYGGGCDPLRSFDAYFGSASELESIVEAHSDEEYVERVHVGLVIPHLGRTIESIARYARGSQE